MYKINPRISWKKKEGVFAIYYRFNFYFLKGKPFIWFGNLLEGKTKIIHKDFIDYLKERKILL